MKRVTFPFLWNRRYIALPVFILVQSMIFAQQEQPLIRATSAKVDIKDGEIYQKAVWNLSPKTKPDIYYALEPIREKKITFYTDIDSISFSVVPGYIYPFIILLNNKDTCYTQISTIKPIRETDANTGSLEIMSPEILKQDFLEFQTALQEKHAGLYRYKSKRELDKLFDSCLQMVNHAMTRLEFSKSVLFMINAVQDGHTGSNIPRLLMNYYSENEKLFPAYVYFIREKAYILCSRIKELPAGSEVLSIDKRPVAEIRMKLLQYLPADGKIETKRVQTLNNGAFSIIYSWIFGKRDSFAVRFRTPDRKIKTVAINAEFVKDFVCDNGNEGNGNADLQLDFPQPNTALLTIKTFDDNRLAGKQAFPGFLDASINEINAKKITTLVIDLRGNAGGRDDYGALLYSYLANKPFKYFFSIESAARRIQVNENSLLGLQQPRENRFNGKIIFLINGLCFSTTADFCAIARTNDRGIFVGEETGGGYYGNTSGETVQVQLPNSKLTITIPLYKYVNDVRKARYNDRGILPDYEVLPTISEVIGHKDVQLNLALELAK